jgi:hypothetical protein
LIIKKKGEANMSEQIKKIVSLETADDFFNWISENQQIDNIQGYAIRRLDDGRVSYFGNHIADIDWIWSERHILNDWIDRVIKDNLDAGQPDGSSGERKIL